VPPLGTLERTAQGTLYVGFINSVDEMLRAKLRRLVNQMIYKPFEEFNERVVLASVNFKEKVPEVPAKFDKMDISLTVSDVKDEKREEIGPPSIKRRSWSNIKSKL